MGQTSKMVPMYTNVHRWHKPEEADQQRARLVWRAKLTCSGPSQFGCSWTLSRHLAQSRVAAFVYELMYHCCPIGTACLGRLDSSGHDKQACGDPRGRRPTAGRGSEHAAHIAESWRGALQPDPDLTSRHSPYTSEDPDIPK
jgi:hypothetical protein